MNVAASLRSAAGLSPRAAAAPDVVSRPLRFLALMPKPTGVSPGQRFRLEQWAPIARAQYGITLDFLPFESPALTQVLYRRGHTVEKSGLVMIDFFRRLAAVVRARRYDGVIIYREAALIGPALYERLLSWIGVPILFDFDDAIWSPGDQGSSVNGIFSRLHFWSKTSTICALADAVTVGNAYLADYARARNDNVVVLPTSIDLKEYPLQPPLVDDDPFVICWTGSTSTLDHFEVARPALEQLAARRRIIVRVICNKPPERPIAGAGMQFIEWQKENEAESIGAAHVGIMPLPDNDYTRGKCGLKALQYMATGLPVVVAPVGMNADLIRDGDNGFLASSDEEWIRALTTLADSRPLRCRMGLAGRATIEQGYSAEAVAKLFADKLQLTINRTK